MATTFFSLNALCLSLQTIGAFSAETNSVSSVASSRSLPKMAEITKNTFFTTFSNDNDQKECVEEYCMSETILCMENDVCRDFIACSSYCIDYEWYKDNTIQKVHGQNCTMKCSASYQNNVTNTYMACLFKYNCIDFPPINVTCPVYNLTRHLDKNTSIATLEGEWWQHYGYNALWDCYPCQHIHSMKQINVTNWNYTYSYEIYTVNNSLDYLQQS